MGEHELTANMEDYLETIGGLAENKGVVRVKEIGRAQGVTPPSVHAALHLLVDKGLIEHEHYGYVRLTDAGAELARRIAARHGLLEEFLRDFLGVSGDTARDDACRMEHVISECTLERLESFLGRLKDLPAREKKELFPGEDGP